MAKTDLLTAVLPKEGWYCIVGLKQQGHPRQVFVETLDEASDEIENLLSQSYDVYFACAKYGNDVDGRTQKNSTYFKSFWLDIDCGVGKPYTTQEEGLAALEQFCKTINMPMPSTVNSGRGIHVYWRLAQTISRNQWKPVADRIKYLCEEHKFKADGSRTAESASILRVPETFNYKQAEPLPVSIINITDEMDYEDVKKRLGVLVGPDYIPRQYNQDTNTRKNSQSRFKTIMLKTLDGKGCNQIANLVENQATLDEPRWRAVLSIATHCVDRDIAIHAVSKEHPEYDPAATERKAEKIEFPYSCEKMEYYNPGFCKDCQHKNKIKNPIQLGNEILVAEPDAPIVSETPKGEKQVFKVPEFPFPYFRGKNGGVYRQSADEEDEPTLIYEHDLYVVKRLNDPKRGDAVWIRLHLPKDGVREFAIPQTEAMTIEKLRDKLSWHGVAAPKKQMEGVMSYIISFIKDLQNRERVEIMRTQFGWTDNDAKFILGDQEISAVGNSYSPPSADTGSLADWMTPVGSLKEWQAIAQTYSMEGFEPHAFGFFTAFGAPLIKHLNLKGAIVNLINNTSGTGKSTVLKMCNSVYGHPEELMLQWKDTYNVKIHRLGIMNNLPVTVDEITKMTGDEFSDFAYSISQGRGKGRMKSQDNAERVNLTKWGTVALCSSNASFQDKLTSLKATPDGELMRLIEYRIEMTDNLSKEQADAIFNGLYSNYGYPGKMYIEYLVANLEDAIDTVKQVQQKLDAEIGFTNRERFWSAVAACNIAGALMAKDIGIIPDFNIGRVYRWLVQELTTMRSETKAPSSNQASVIGEFMNEHRASTLVINGEADCRTGMELLPIVEPKFNDLFIRIEPDTKRLFINAKQIRSYCSKHQITLKDVLKGLAADKIYLGEVKKRISKGTKVSSPPVSVLVFSLDNEHFLDTEALIETVKAAPDVDPQTQLQN